ncbi:hypothetical protein V7138_10585 [Bacillus sp. JJ1533]|uniref:hypothetical protein n=1 Tax=Bacillus sp. JJ1533 TaxID=3122959 RepID=UPI003000DB1D
MRNVYCERCSAEITDKSNLIITTHFVSIKAYHDHCYSKSLKGWETVFVGNEPINGTSGNIKAFFGLIVAMILFLVGGPYAFLGAIVLYLPIMRWYAWYSIERHVE